MTFLGLVNRLLDTINHIKSDTVQMCNTAAMIGRSPLPSPAAMLALCGCAHLFFLRNVPTRSQREPPLPAAAERCAVSGRPLPASRPLFIVTTRTLW